MVMGNNKKYFSPSLKDEILAARAYDRFQIQTMGLSAKTNFHYTRGDLILIIKDIKQDLASVKDDGESCIKISFCNFKIKQSEIMSDKDLLRIQQIPVRRLNIPRLIK